MSKLAPTHAAILLPVLALAAIPVHAQPRLSTQDATAPQPAAIDARRQIETYSEIARRSYEDAWQAAQKLQQVVDTFVKAPTDDSDESLSELRQAWLDARPSYGRTEAFRFYEGPIDFGRRPDGTQGPELLVNAWPLNEAYIDSVRGDPAAGLVNASDVPITRATLVERNAAQDEADVTTGYHAIEFLLWGRTSIRTVPAHAARATSSAAPRPSAAAST